MGKETTGDFILRLPSKAIVPNATLYEYFTHRNILPNERNPKMLRKYLLIICVYSLYDGSQFPGGTDRISLRIVHVTWFSKSRYLLMSGNLCKYA